MAEIMMTTRSEVVIGTPATHPVIAMIGDMKGPHVGMTTGTEENTNTTKSMKEGGPEAMRKGIDVIGRRITTGEILSRTAGIMREMIEIGTMMKGGTETEMTNMEETTRRIAKMIGGIMVNMISTKKTATENMSALQGPLNMTKKKVTATTRMRGLPLRSQKDIRKRMKGTKRKEKDTPKKEIVMSRMTVIRMTDMPAKTIDMEIAIKRTIDMTSTGEPIKNISDLTMIGARNTLEKKFQTPTKTSSSHTSLGLTEDPTISRALLRPTTDQIRDDVDY
jgi:hypothetical protein